MAVPIETLRIHDLDHRLNRLSLKINQDTGFYWWRRYIYSAFWSLVSTPINLTITIFTALTTGQSSSGIISDHLSLILGIVTLILSVINTFFRPGQQLLVNQTSKEKWSELGVEFEEIYFSNAYSEEEKKSKLVKYEKLFERVSDLKKGIDNNYLIDLIYTIARKFCMRSPDILWIPEMTAKFKAESKSSSLTGSSIVCSNSPPHGHVQETEI
jgi:hypothetical protein